MTIPQIVGQNIRTLMDQRQISIRDMGKIIGVTHPTMSKYLQGTLTIDSEKLYIIAQYFGRTMDEFYHESNTPDALLFRFTGLPFVERQQILDDLQCRIDSYLHCVQPTLQYTPQQYQFTPGKRSTQDIENRIELIAKAQRRCFGIENIIPESYFDTLSSKGVHVICTDIENFPNPSTSMVSTNQGSCIIINTTATTSLESQIHALIYELGQLTCHLTDYYPYHGEPIQSARRREVGNQIAQLFTHYFLMPRNMVNQYIEDLDMAGKHIDVVEMKMHFQVDIRTLCKMLCKYGHMDRDKYTNFMQKLDDKGYQQTEFAPLPMKTFNELNPRLIRAIQSRKSIDQGTLYAAATLMNQEITEVGDIVHSGCAADDDLTFSL